MPRLTVKAVNAKKTPGMYGDGAGLYLRVGPTCAKSWILRTVIRGRRRELGLGGVDLVTLAEARDKAREMRKVAREGGDPDAERKAAAKALREAEARDAMTFAEAARHTRAMLQPKWRSAREGEIWLSSIERYANPHFGERAIGTLDKNDIRRALDAIWTEKPETARRLRQRLSAIFAWAKAEDFYVGDNPVSELDGVLTAVQKQPRHRPSLPWRDLPGFMAQLGEREGTSARCLEFIILTAARSGEARGARWTEMDFEGARWIVPPERMKSNKEHRVPLSPAALDLLNGMRGLDPVLVFPSPQRAEDGTGKVMSDMTFKALMGRMKVEGITTHGFRSTFRDWCSESAKADPELAEAALSHATGNTVTRAYARSDLIDRRRALMDAWAAHATGATGDVVRLVRT